MKILYVAMKHDYGFEERGLSFEHHNFFDSLREMGHDLLYFDFMALLNVHGREGMNNLLYEVAKAEEPELMFSVLFTDQLDPRVIRRISRRTDTITVNWFADDHWRFETFSKDWAPNFNWVVTTASSALPKYAAIRYRNVIKSQWACNQFLYRKLDLPLRYDVTFVGQPHGDRREVIDVLRRAGVDVRVWGYRWESGRLSQDEMIRVFNQSRINLSLSNASRPQPRIPTATERVGGTLEQRHVGRVVKRSLRPLVRSIRRARAQDGPPPSPVVPEQIKGRNFEVPGCGGFLLTGRADDLERYYEPGREIALFESPDELVERVRYYLGNEDERASIAEAGYERTLREHTYVQRFEEIFERVGLPRTPAPPRGEVVEIA